MDLKFGKDESRCSGCRTCELVCGLANTGECNPKNSFIKITGNFPIPGGYNIKMKGCKLCGECFKYCPMGAIYLKSGEPEPREIYPTPSRSSLTPGYAGKILRVDLTNDWISKIPLPPKMVKDYLGGRGFAAYLLYRLLKKGAEPLGYENKVIIASGPLSGTFTPAAGKVHFASKSPLTGIYGDSNMGGHFAGEMKYAGYDVIVIEGKAPKPSYIFIEDEKVEIRDASHLWGLGSFETEAKLKEGLGDEFQIAVIGPAGENLVRFACVSHDFGRQAGRTGIGAVLGSKNIKAIAIRGTKSIPIADTREMIEKGKQMFEHCFNQPAIKDWQKYGTGIVVDMSNEWGSFPTKNFQSGYFPEHPGLSHEAMRKEIVLHDKACFSCPMACGKYSRAKKEGKYDVHVEGPEYETSALCGGNVGIKDIKDVAYANWLCDDLGLDTISTGSVIAFAIECFQKGIFALEDTQGRELKFNDIETFEYLARTISERKTPLGSILSKGVKKAAMICSLFNPEAEKFAIHIKGLEISGYEFRAAPAMMLAYLTCDVGGHHNRACSITKDLDKGASIQEKIEWDIYLQHVRPMFDNLGVCRLLWVELGLLPEKYSGILKAVTGTDYSLDDLLKISERVWNLTRAFSAREAEEFGRSWDQPPRRFLEEEVPDGPNKGAKVSQEMVDQMLNEYYRLRGWTENGIPTKEKLKELGLDFVIKDLYP